MVTEVEALVLYNRLVLRREPLLGVHVDLGSIVDYGWTTVDNQVTFFGVIRHRRSPLESFSFTWKLAPNHDD